MASKKKAATAALLGEPVNAGPAAAAASSASMGTAGGPTKKKKLAGGGVGVKKEGGEGPSLEKRFVSLLSAHPKGLGQADLYAGLGCEAADVVEIINNLLGRHRLELLQDGEGNIHYKLVSADKVEKLRGLSNADVLIYQLVEASGSQGIWIKDLRRKSGLPALDIPKQLKELQRRRLIKCERSIQAANKKVYMLYDIEPAREVSGGAWYDKRTGEFDTEYMAGLEATIMHFLDRRAKVREMNERGRGGAGGAAIAAAASSASNEAQGLASAEEVETYLAETGAFKTVPSAEEIGKILQGLVYEGRVERVEDEAAAWALAEEDGMSNKMGAAAAAAESPSARKRRRAAGDARYLYRSVRAGAFVSSFPSIPCATCPVAHLCHEGNPISPQSCEYLAQWLQF
jgi:DNA-directed RNA polymerase III subunit RPC6